MSFLHFFCTDTRETSFSTVVQLPTAYNRNENVGTHWRTAIGVPSNLAFIIFAGITKKTIKWFLNLCSATQFATFEIRNPTNSADILNIQRPRIFCDSFYLFRHIFITLIIENTVQSNFTTWVKQIISFTIFVISKRRFLVIFEVIILRIANFFAHSSLRYHIVLLLSLQNSFRWQKIS